jgi:hypothetical protein
MVIIYEDLPGVAAKDLRREVQDQRQNPVTLNSKFSARSAGIVSVLIDHASTQEKPAGWHLDYSVRNIGPATAWLVVDQSPVFTHEGSHIELSYARAKLQPGATLFGYFDPAVVKLAAGETIRRTVTITWPLSLSDLWNTVREAAPAPGEYSVSIRIGFGSTAKPESPKAGESVEAPVFRWQYESVSPPVKITVPPYPSLMDSPQDQGSQA